MSLMRARVCHVKVGQYAAVTDELDNAGRYQEDRAEYAGQTGQQRAFLCFLQVFRAEYALHDGLVGAPVGDVVDAAAKYNHRPRNVRRLCVSRLDRIQVLRRGGSEMRMPSAMLPSPSAINARTGIRMTAPMMKMMPFRESDTGYGLQAAEDCIDTADDAECDAHYSGCHKAIAAHQCGMPKIRSIATEPAYSTSGSMVTI